MKTANGAKITRVICDNHGGKECNRCPHNTIHTSADGGCKSKKSFCPYAFEGMQGGDVQCH